MPIISAEVVDKKNYRITIAMGNCMVENVVITEDGLYCLHYIKDGKAVNHTGRILNVVQNKNIPQNSYLLFDWSDDNSNRKERVYFYQVQVLQDVTPNDAYRIAVNHGFVGSVDDWLESMRGYPGKDNYEIAVDCGFEGTREEYLEQCKGERGYSAFDIAKQNGFEGTEEEWLDSLRGKDGKSAYELAVEHGYEGTEEDYVNNLRGADGKSAYDIAKENGFAGTEEEWVNSLRGKDGKSAYELAVEHGYEGTESDWLASLGDVTALNEKINNVEGHLVWIDSMNNE